MFFWFFMLVVDLFTPILMLGIGWLFMKHPPRDINAFIGYRTSMSMKNEETWLFSHRFCGKLWFWTGLILLAPSVIPLLFFIGKSTDVVSLVGVIVMCVQMLILVATIIPVEIALHKYFDKFGNRISKK